MKVRRGILDIRSVKTLPFFSVITALFLVLIASCFLFNGCTALKEAQQEREARLKKKKDARHLMMEPSKSEPTVAADAQKAESEHYTLAFADDLKGHEKFDELRERRDFALSALGYMESVYDEMNAVFGFQPEHKIHVTLHAVYNGTTRVASTTTQYNYESVGNTTLKVVTGIKMDYPLAMYEKPGVRVHELTHAFTNIYFLPTWFNEGIAVLMQTEWAKGGLHPKFDSLQRNLKRNMAGENDLEDWASHGGDPKLTDWRYRYAYTIVSELRKRYGADFYIKVFRLMEADQLHNKLPSKMPTIFLVYYLSQAAGVDLVPFFTELAFNVHKLTKEEILQNINQMNR